MTANDVLGACQHFLAVVDPDTEFADREAALAVALDALALAYGRGPAGIGGAEVAEPDDLPSSEAVRARVTRALPELGLYNVAMNLEDVGNGELGVGDAIDDVADVARDLQEVVTRWETDVDDALFHFRLLFETHWGRHLRELQLYLHARRY